MSDIYGEQTLAPGERDTKIGFAEADGNVGSWERPGGVGTVHGAEGSVIVLDYNSSSSDGADTTVAVGELSGEAYINDQEVRVGVEANLVEVDATFGEFDPYSSRDSSVTFGHRSAAGLGSMHRRPTLTVTA